MNENTLLIGVDAADFRTIDRLVDDGKMPTFESLMSEGYEAILNSSFPPWTPTAWTSLTSGKNAGKHGIFDFKSLDGERMVNANDVTSHRLWTYLDENDLCSIVVNVPVTHPAPEIEGIIVPGYLGPKADEMQPHPDGIIDELRSEIGDYRIYKRNGMGSDEEVCEEYLKLMEMRKDAICYLCGEYEWDFAMVQFQRTDTVFHELRKQRYINRVYENLDAYVGEIIATIEPNTTLVASDHGMGELGDWDVRINSWLKQKGYLETSNTGIEVGWEKPGEEKSLGMLERFIAGLSRAGITAQRIESGLSRIGFATVIRSVLPDEMLAKVVAVGGEKIDRESSQAYCPSGSCQGIVCRQAIKSTLRNELMEIKDPDGYDVFEWVRPSDEVLSGEFVNEAPDLLMMPRDMEYFMSAVPTSSVFEEGRYEFTHKPEGILLITGSGVEANEQRATVSIHQVAPTILSLFDIPLDKAFDGKPITDPLTVEIPGEQIYEWQHTATNDDVSQDIESRLRQLGYLE